MINLGEGPEEAQDAPINQDQITDVLFLLQLPKRAHNAQQQFTGFEIYDCRNSGGATDWNSNSDSRLL